MRRFLLAAPLLLILAACGSTNPSEDRGMSGPGLYIALGDSLSEGVGASNRDTTSFVPLVREGLGDGYDLINLGHSGDTSSDLLEHGHLEQAVAEVGARNDDDDPNNDVRLVTLEIGGNDLLRLYSSPLVWFGCPPIKRSLERRQCVDALRETLDRLATNVGAALDGLREAGPDLTIVVMTLYNPLSGPPETTAELAEMVLEGQPDGPLIEGLNDILRDEGAKRGAVLVDWHPLFEDRADEYIARDFIHPNDAGYEVMAEAVLEAVR